MNYLKSLKDGKRRAVENVLEATGKSEKTVDENYEVDYEQYQELIHYIQSSKSAIKNLLLSQKLYYENIQKHAGFLHDLHEKNNNPTNPSATVIFLLLGEQCEKYLNSINILINKHRPAAESIMYHYSIQPLEELIESITSEVNEVIRQRELYLTDYDSYRRRIKTCKEKMEKIQTTIPVNQNKLEECQHEMSKLTTKHANAETHYLEYNSRAKMLLKDSRRKILNYVEKHVVTSLTCQAELCDNTAGFFNSILDTIEPSQVEEIRLAIRESIGSNENYPPRKYDNSSERPVEKPPAIVAPQIIHPVEPAAEQQHFHFNEDVHHQEEINHPPPLPPMPPPTIPLPPRPTQPPPSSNPFFELEDDIIEPSYAPPPIPSISPDDM